MKKTIVNLLQIIVVFILLTNPVMGKNQDNTFQWQIEDVLFTPTITNYNISPNGEWLVWTVSKWNLKDQKKYQLLYLVSLTKKVKHIQLTRAEETISSIEWLPSSDAISFKTSRKFKDTKPGNLWLINIQGGEAYPVTNFKKGIMQYHWLDKENLLYIARETESLLELEIKKQKDTSEVVEDQEHQAVSRLFHYDLKKKKVRRLTDNKKPMESFTLSPDKKWVTYGVHMSIRYTQDQKTPPRYFLMNLESGKEEEILIEKNMAVENITWAKNSTGFYTTIPYCTHPRYRMAAVSKIYWYDLSSKAAKEIDLDWDRYGGPIQVTPKGFFMALPHGVYNKHALYTRTGKVWKRQWIKGDEQKNFSNLRLAKDGRTMVYAKSTSSMPERYYLAKLKGNSLLKKWEIMDIKSSFFKKPLVKSEILQWQGARGDDIQGILYYPNKYEPGKKYPLILRIHGGPNARDRDLFMGNYGAYNHLLCERGTFMLKVNYHGSTGYGIEFGESIAGHYYEYEVPDIEKGVDSLIARGLVDPEKLGVMGWSNGAILGTALTIHSNRYKVASLGAGDVNWTSDYGNCAFGVAFDNYYFGGPPWEKLEHYIKKSPLFQLHKVTTPTLIFHGSNDRAVPYEQGWEYYRALQVIGKAPVRFLSFPGEPHGFRKFSHRKRKIKEELIWLDKYLFKTYKKINEALKKGSPLALLLKSSKIAQSEGWYGVKMMGILTPETLKYKKLEVGRFEVTRAQWAAFDTDYSYPLGSGNMPVTGISFERALEYVGWLSQTTGEAYRLPGKDEIKTLYEARDGNILDYWAGYKLNPGDLEKLVTEFKSFGPEPVLLKTVGSFPPMGENPIYDLGGNAAEWVQIEGNKGQACGGSAERPADKMTKLEPKIKYTGFRVIKKKN